MIEIVTIVNQNWSLVLHKRESVQNTKGQVQNRCNLLLSCINKIYISLL
jgi:hypothetical protein